MRPMSAGLFVAVGAALALALPVRREVVGMSMAPGLMPGDRVASGAFPWRDRWRSPGRHERWIVSAPDGTDAIKRVVGCGGQTLRIVDGDLAVDGRIEPPPPGVLMQRATVVRQVVAVRQPGALEIVADGKMILDDVAFAPDERRLLLPVADVGTCIFVRADHAAGMEPAERIVIGIGERSVTWRPSGPGSFVFLAGRVDRHLVAAAWRHSGEDDDHGIDRHHLPQDAPVRWAIASEWNAAAGSRTPRLTVFVGGPRPLSEPERDGGEGVRLAGGLAVERILVWRDVLYRPAADGTTEWTLGADDVFLLGDFPSGSIDSRHWGPLSRRALRHRVTAVNGSPRRQPRGELR